MPPTEFESVPPGLAIRIIGAITRERVHVLKRDDAMTADWAHLPCDLLETNRVVYGMSRASHRARSSGSRRRAIR